MTSGYLGQLEKILEEVLAIAEGAGKLSGFCIGNTSKVDASGLYFSPIRNTPQLVAGSVIVYEAHHAAEIANIVDGKVEYLLVDAEKKVSPEPEYFGEGDRGNIERAVRDVVKTSTVLTYKGNDLTVDSIDCVLTQLAKDVTGIGGKKVAIIGAGNLGTKLALRLVERGADVVITRRNKQKLETIAEASNFIKPERTFGAVVATTDNEEAAKDADILVGMTTGIPVITSRMVDRVADAALIMDAGKGCLFPDAINRARERGLTDAGKGCLFPDAINRARERGLTVLRVDVRSGFDGHVAMLLRTEDLLRQTLGRRIVDGIPLVSGGLLAWEGEIVVDDVYSPGRIYGVANGQGDFIRTLSTEQSDSVMALQKLIDRHVAVERK